MTSNSLPQLMRLIVMSTAIAAAIGTTISCPSLHAETPAAQTGAPYQNRPLIAPIGERADRYLSLPASVASQAIDPAKGYRIQELGRGLFMVTDNAYQSMFMIYERGVVVVDAPPNYSAKLRQAISEVTNLPVTHVIYSHSHVDHIGGVNDIGARPIVIAHEETGKILARANDPRRPMPTVTFRDNYKLELGSQVLELSYHGVAHEPGNIFISAPEQRVLMVVDVVFPRLDALAPLCARERCCRLFCAGRKDRPDTFSDLCWRSCQPGWDA